MRFDRVYTIKVLLVAAAILIAAASLFVSGQLIDDLKREERVKMETWAEAMRTLINADDNTDLSLVLRVINSNHTIPVILLDENGSVLDHRNVDTPARADSLAILQREADRMATAGRVLKIPYPDASPQVTPEGRGTNQLKNLRLCYDESLLLRRLSAYPYVWLGVVALFIFIALFALFSSMRSEQNKVWVGLSRETAHQLGTPISSLMAWTEILRESYPHESLLDDMAVDVERLQLIAQRFSKIGSAPELVAQDMTTVVRHAVDYMQRRTSGRVTITLEAPDAPIIMRLNASLLEWVIENLCKNAVDAMSGIGSIHLRVALVADSVLCTVADTGRGIPKSQFKRVFRPGFTTKARGWGLGLSLAKRIIEQYHGGSIIVKESTPGRGTTFEVKLPLESPNSKLDSEA